MTDCNGNTRLPQAFDQAIGRPWGEGQEFLFCGSKENPSVLHDGKVKDLKAGKYQAKIFQHSAGDQDQAPAAALEARQRRKSPDADTTIGCDRAVVITDQGSVRHSSNLGSDCR